MKKGIRFKSSIAILTALVVSGFSGTGDLKAVHAAEKYGKAYTITNVLSDYQYFVEGDLKANNVGHCKGAVAVGGTLDSVNTVGDAQVATSYVRNIKNLADFRQGIDVDATSYKSYKVKTFYYDTVDKSLCTGKGWLVERLTRNADYIDFNTAFNYLQRESDTLAQAGNDSSTLKEGILTINLNCNKDMNVTIPYSKISSAKSIVIAGIPSVECFAKYEYVISVTGVNRTNFKLSCEGDDMKLNGTPFNQVLNKLEGAKIDLNLNGMKLVWNFPDATGCLNAHGLAGHLVAPNADITLTGGNFDGGIIAKCVSNANAEGHYYIYNRPGCRPHVPTCTPKPTKAPTNTPTPTKAPTNTPTPTKAPTNTPTPTKAPTNTPTHTQVPTSTPVPTKPTSTPVPTQAPTSTTVPTQTPTSTTAPTQAPTSTTAPTNIPTPTNAPTATTSPTTTTPDVPYVYRSSDVTNISVPIVTVETPTSTPAPSITATPTTVPTNTQTLAQDTPKGEDDIAYEVDDTNIKVASVEKTPAKVSKKVTINNDTPKGTSSPKTGEHTPLIIFVVIALVSGVGITFLMLRKRAQR